MPAQTSQSFNGDKVLVTGGAGFIGSHAVDMLLARGARVTVIDNLSAGKVENLPLDNDALELVEGDINGAAALEHAIRDARFCLHLAAQVSVVRSVADPVHSATQNILGTVSVMQAAAKAGVEKLVYASSAAVYGTPAYLPLDEQAPLAPLSPYGLEKQVDEQYAQLFASMHGLASLGMRFFNVYGPRQDPNSPYAGVISKFVERLTSGQVPTVFGDGRQTRDFVYVEDVATACLAALQGRLTGVCNVATGQTIDLLGLLDVLGDVTGQKIPPQHAEPRSDDILHSCGDASRFNDALGIKARWSLKDGLRRLVTAAQ